MVKTFSVWLGCIALVFCVAAKGEACHVDDRTRAQDELGDGAVCVNTPSVDIKRCVRGGRRFECVVTFSDVACAPLGTEPAAEAR